MGQRVATGRAMRRGGGAVKGADGPTGEEDGPMNGDHGPMNRDHTPMLPHGAPCSHSVGPASPLTTAGCSPRPATGRGPCRARLRPSDPEDNTPVMPTSDPRPTERFTERVEAYVKYRPSYPPEALRAIRAELGV